MEMTVKCPVCGGTKFAEIFSVGISVYSVGGDAYHTSSSRVLTGEVLCGCGRILKLAAITETGKQLAIEKEKARLREAEARIRTEAEAHNAKHRADQAARESQAVAKKARDEAFRTEQNRRNDEAIELRRPEIEAEAARREQALREARNPFHVTEEKMQ